MHSGECDEKPIYNIFVVKIKTAQVADGFEVVLCCCCYIFYLMTSKRASFSQNKYINNNNNDNDIYNCI